VTDANLLLGLLASDAPLAGGVELDLAAARGAVGQLADELGLELVDCAQGIRRVAGAEMVRALRVVTVQRGIDPRGFALLPFGGAGPLHATQIADELGIDKIVCPRASGVLAAVGLVVSPRRRDVQRSVLLAGDDLTAEAIAATVSELGQQARSALNEDQAELSATYELRYRGQAFELAVTAPTEPDPGQLREAFEEQHEDRYGYSDSEQTLELVTIRVTATVAGAEVTLAPDIEEAKLERGSRDATLGGEQVELDVLRGAPPPGTEVQGPAAVDLPESTLIVPAQWSGQVDDSGTIHLERKG
jgi:N-methylhydantoinase A